MNFNGFSCSMSVDGDIVTGAIKDDKIPKQYHEFIPGNQEKTKADWPYNYDPFLIYFNEKAKQLPTSTIYTDRLRTWDWDKNKRLCRKHFGNEGDYWHDREHKKIEAFLCDWTGRNIMLIAVIQYVNVRNGYPYWRLDFCEFPEKEKTTPMGKDNT